MTDAIVFYRWPNQTNWTILEGNRTDFDPKNHSQGFILAPFVGDETGIIIPSKIEQTNNFPAARIEELVAVFEKFLLAGEKTDLNDYMNALYAAIDAVNHAELKKVIVSRKQMFDVSYNSFTNGFERLSHAFPNTFLYVLFSRKHGIWFGASPEVLVEEKADSFFTMALAGTIRSESDIEMKDWKQKEIEEQKFVADYVAELLNKQSINYMQEKTGIQRTGNIHHLVSHFHLMKKKGLSLFEIAEFLHPTPAICGLPVNDARSFILKNEGYQRELYTGFLGPFGFETNNGFFVNLRCGKWMKNGLVLFAGGGINKGSVAEDELNETKNKMENTLRFFT